MGQPAYEDKHDYSPATGFRTTNEEPEVFRVLLGRSRGLRVGAIASGGEILIMTMMPRAIEEIVAVDHSYESLYAAYTKLLLLDKLGAKGFREILLSMNLTKFKEEVASVEQFIPAKIKEGHKLTYRGYNYYGQPLPAGPLRDSDLQEMRREFFYTSDTMLEAARKNISKLTLIHGDLKDLAERGPFDLLYVSNAIEHNGRDGKHPNARLFHGMLKVGGTLISTGGMDRPSDLFKGAPELQLRKTFKGLRTSWYYFIHEAKPLEVHPTPVVA